MSSFVKRGGEHIFVTISFKFENRIKNKILVSVRGREDKERGWE